MYIRTFKRITPSAVACDIEFRMDELLGLPNWCQVVLNDMLNGFGHPLEVIDAVHAIAHQINRQSTSKPDTSPPLEGDLKAQNVKEVGSGPAVDTIHVGKRPNVAHDTCGTSAPEGGEKSGEVAQGKSCGAGCKCLNIKRFKMIEDWLDDLETSVARVETWARHVSGVKYLVDRPRKGD